MMNASRYYTVIIHHVTRWCLGIVVELRKNRYGDPLVIDLVLVTLHSKGFPRASLSICKHCSMIALYNKSVICDLHQRLL